MKTLKMFGDFDPLDTKPSSSAKANPHIKTVPSLDDSVTEIKWNSPSYLGQWTLSGPNRKKQDAFTIAKEMKLAETGSSPYVDRLPPLDIFMSSFAQKLNPLSWTLDFSPEDLDYSSGQATSFD